MKRIKRMQAWTGRNSPKDWPLPPPHVVLMLYTLVGVLALSVVSSSYSFQCV